jgi:hypothetical protein
MHLNSFKAARPARVSAAAWNRVLVTAARPRTARSFNHRMEYSRDVGHGNRRRETLKGLQSFVFPFASQPEHAEMIQLHRFGIKVSHQSYERIGKGVVPWRPFHGGLDVGKLAAILELLTSSIDAARKFFELFSEVFELCLSCVYRLKLGHFFGELSGM